MSVRYTLLASNVQPNSKCCYSTVISNSQIKCVSLISAIYKKNIKKIQIKSRPHSLGKCVGKCSALVQVNLLSFCVIYKKANCNANVNFE